MGIKRQCAVCTVMALGVSLASGGAASAHETSIAVPCQQEAVWDELAVTNDDTVETGVNIRRQADEDGQVIGYLYEGGAAWVISRGEEWTEIYSGGLTGFVKNEYLVFGDDAKAAVENHGVEGVATTWEDVKLYSGADGGSEVLDTLKYGDSFILTQDEGHWLQVQRGADSSAYVSSEDVSRVMLMDTAVAKDASFLDAESGGESFPDGSSEDGGYAADPSGEDSWTDDPYSGDAADVSSGEDSWTEESWEDTDAASYASGASEDTYTDGTYADDAYTDDTYTDGAYTDDAYTDDAYTDDAYTDDTYTDDGTYTDSTYTEENYTGTSSSGQESYYDPETGIYFDAGTGLYYDSGTGILYDAWWNPVNADIATPPSADAGSDEYAQTGDDGYTDTSADDPSDAAAETSAGAGDTDLLAALIYCEAGNQSYDGMVAVGAVVMNRVNSSSFPNSVSEVIYQSGQFTPASSGALASALANGVPSTCYDAAAAALSGENPIGDALYFNTGSGKGTKLGDHQFY